MTLIKKPAIFINFIWISLCSSQSHKRDYSSGNGGTVGGMGGSDPFADGSTGMSAGFGGQMQSSGGGGSGKGINPFSNMAKSKRDSPFASAAGTGDGIGSGGMGAGPFSSGMKNAGGGGSFNGGGGSGNSGAGNGAGPFSSGMNNAGGGGSFNGGGGSGNSGAGMGAGPFASGMNNAGGGGSFNGAGGSGNSGAGNGAGPFASGMNNAGGGGSFNGGGGSGNSGAGMGAGPFASGMNNAGGGGSFNSGGGSGNSGAGMGAGPFSSGTAGSGNSNGASPFASALGNGGYNDNGVGPFAGGMSGKGSSPFSANMDSNGKGGMSGVDLSSLMNSGPGGLTGGAFLTTNISKLMGQDYSKDLGNGGGQFGEMSLGQGQSENKIGVDNSRFDTTAYQHMLQQLFSTDNSGQELKDMGTPFDGNTYTNTYNSNGDEHHNAAMEASVGSFASTDTSSYEGHSGTATGQASSQYQGLQKGNAEQYTGNGSGSYSGGSNMASSGSDNGGTYSNPFDVNNYDMGHVSPNSGGATGMGSGSNMNKGQNPFDTSNFNAGKNPFSSNSNYNGAGSTSGNGVWTGGVPFDTSKFGTLAKNSNKQSESGQNPFDTSKYQASGSNMMGNQQYQNMETGNVDHNKGLDEYGNVNFGTLSGLSGNTMDTGAAGGLDLSSHLSRTGNGEYRAEYTGTGSTYSGTRTGYNAESKSQYETPFEADNYNDLLGNPFKSDSYFDTTKQNFKLPYETNSNLQQSSYSNSGPSVGYGEGQYSGSGPAGDPFHQGGNSMGASNAMRG